MSNPSFRRASDASDALAEMTRLRAAKAFESQEPTELDGAIDELIEKNLLSAPADWSEVTHKVIQGVIEGIDDPEDADWAIRRASHRAILAVARRWGNVVSAGKASVVASREAASRTGLDGVRAAQQAGLGAIEGVLQVGPVAYPVLHQEIAPIVEDFLEVLQSERESGEWMLRSLERSSIQIPELPPLPPLASPRPLLEAPTDAPVESEPKVTKTPAVSSVPVLESKGAAPTAKASSSVETDQPSKTGSASRPASATLATAPTDQTAPAKAGFWQRVSGWFRGLFGGK